MHQSDLQTLPYIYFLHYNKAVLFLISAIHPKSYHKLAAPVEKSKIQYLAQGHLDSGNKLALSVTLWCPAKIYYNC